MGTCAHREMGLAQGPRPDRRASPREGVHPDRAGDLATSCWVLIPFCAHSRRINGCPAGGQGPPHQRQPLQQQPVVRRGRPPPQPVRWLSAGRHRHLPGRSLRQGSAQRHRQPRHGRPDTPRHGLCLASRPPTAGSPPLAGLTSPSPAAAPCPGPHLSQRPGALPRKPIQRSWQPRGPDPNPKTSLLHTASIAVPR